MSKKKVIKTSKTAHVMNLISKNYDPASEAAQPAGAEAATQTAPVSAQGENPDVGSVTPAAGTAVSLEPAITDTPAAPTLPLLSADMEITAQIRSALEDLVEEPSPTTEESPAPADEEEPVSTAEESTATVEDEEPAPMVEENSDATEGEEPAATVEENSDATEGEEPAATVEENSDATEGEEPAATVEESPEEESPTPAPKAAVAEESGPAFKTAPAQENEDENICINIMQELVEQNTDHYVKMFGLCTCSRCVADVKAIAMNSLVPQYVVAPRREAPFRVTIYHERFHGEVTAQILRACRIVMDSPRHGGRKGG